MASRCSAGVLAVCKATFALALALPFAFAFALVVWVVPELVITFTNASRLGPPEPDSGVGLPFNKASWLVPSAWLDMRELRDSLVVFTDALDSIESFNFSRSVNFDPVVHQNLVDSGSVGASGSAMPWPFLMIDSIFSLGSQMLRMKIYRKLLYISDISKVKIFEVCSSHLVKIRY